MKINLISISAILLIASCFTSCDKDDDVEVGYNCVNGDCVQDNSNPIFTTLSDCEQSCVAENHYPDGTVHCNPSTPTAVVDVFNPVTGKTWMDRNLGASRVANGSIDVKAYGDRYQWGRSADGHQCISSFNSFTFSDSDQPGHGNFIITAGNSPWDWRSPQNSNLWQGLNGINNPCPMGYRVPTKAEFDAERSSWKAPPRTSPAGSPLKITMAGSRKHDDGSLFSAGSHGYYWTSTIYNSSAHYLLILNNMNVFMTASNRGSGLSVRCIKD